MGPNLWHVFPLLPASFLLRGPLELLGERFQHPWTNLHRNFATMLPANSLRRLFTRQKFIRVRTLIMNLFLTKIFKRFSLLISWSFKSHDFFTEIWIFIHFFFFFFFWIFSSLSSRSNSFLLLFFYFSCSCFYDPLMHRILLQGRGSCGEFGRNVRLVFLQN